MANKFYLYKSELHAAGGTPDNLIIEVDENIMALYPDIVTEAQGDGTHDPAAAPTAYDTLEDAQTADSGAVINPLISPRGVSLSIAGFGNAFLPILSNKATSFDTAPAGIEFDSTIQSWISNNDPDTAPVGPSEGSLTVLVTGYRGESRFLQG